MNLIIIKGLAVEARVGVPDEERAQPQRLVIDAVLEPRVAFQDCDDAIELTADYDLACREIAALAAETPRRLIETLAADLTAMLIEKFSLRSAEIEVRKFILPQTEYVAVRHRRDART